MTDLRLLGAKAAEHGYSGLEAFVSRRSVRQAAHLSPVSVGSARNARYDAHVSAPAGGGVGHPALFRWCDTSVHIAAAAVSGPS